MEEGDNELYKEKTCLLRSAGIVIEKPNVSWDEIAGLEDAKQMLKERIVLPVKFPVLFTGRSLHGGILLFGPHGTGKSILVNAVATETNNATLFNVPCVDLATMATEVDAAQLMRYLFELAKRHKPCVINFDDIQALFPWHVEDCATEAEYLKRMKTEFLEQVLNLSTEDNGLFVITSTTKPWMLHSYVRRILAYRTYIPLPDAQARATIFKMQLGNTAHSLTDEEFRQLAENSEGYSGTDISIVLRDALMEPARKLMAATHFRKVIGLCMAGSLPLPYVL